MLSSDSSADSTSISGRPSGVGSRSPGIGTSRSEPLSSRPRPSNVPTVTAPKQTVSSAQGVGSPAAPLSASTPEGRSQAMRQAVCGGSGSATPPRAPVPKAASSTTSHPASARSAACVPRRCTRPPAASKAAAALSCLRSPIWMAATWAPRLARSARAKRPSPPLFPGPTRATTLAPATPRPESWRTHSRRGAAPGTSAGGRPRPPRWRSTTVARPWAAARMKRSGSPAAAATARAGPSAARSAAPRKAGSISSPTPRPPPWRWRCRHRGSGRGASGSRRALPRGRPRSPLP